MNNDRLRQTAVVFGAAAQIVGALLVPLGVQSIDVGSRTELVRTPVVPAGYAFSIWGVIFAACAAYAVWQALPSQRADPLLRRLGWWTAAAFTGAAVWEVLAQGGAGDAWLSLVLAGTAAAALVAAVRLARWPEPQTGARWWLVALPIGLFAGWVTAALFANVSTALEAARAEPWPEGVWLLLIAAAAAALSAALAAVRGQVAFEAAALWALVGVAAANWPGGRAAYATAIAGVLLVLAAGAWARNRQKRAGSPVR